MPEDICYEETEVNTPPEGQGGDDEESSSGEDD